MKLVASVGNQMVRITQQWRSKPITRLGSYCVGLNAPQPWFPRPPEAESPTWDFPLACPSINISPPSQSREGRGFSRPASLIADPCRAPAWGREWPGGKQDGERPGWAALREAG